MAVLVVLAAVIVTVGSSVVALVRRWPHADPADPRIGPEQLAAEVTRHRKLRARLLRRPDPAATTGLALSLGALLVVVGALAVGLLLVMVRSRTGLARVDGAVARWAARRATSASTAVLRSVTKVGGTTGMAVAAVAVLLAGRRRFPTGRAAAFLLLVIGGQSLISNTVKLIVDRARPAIDPLAGFAGSSFPSGHSSAAAAGLAAFALLAGRGRPLPVRAWLSGGAAGLAAGVAATRVLLGVHWLTDVLAGLALGWGWFALCSIAFGGRLLRFGAPVVAAEATAAAVARTDRRAQRARPAWSARPARPAWPARAAGPERPAGPAGSERPAGPERPEWPPS